MKFKILTKKRKKRRNQRRKICQKDIIRQIIFIFVYCILLLYSSLVVLSFVFLVLRCILSLVRDSSFSFLTIVISINQQYPLLLFLPLPPPLHYASCTILSQLLNFRLHIHIHIQLYLRRVALF